MLLIVQMIPAQALIIALFLDFDQLNLLQSLPGLVLVYAAQALPVSIWMLRNFVATVPRDLEEAAAVDGAGQLADLLAHPVPAGRPGPDRDQHLLLHHRLQRVHRGADLPGSGALRLHAADLRDVLLPRGGAEWGPIMAASTLYTIPVVVFFLIVQRRMTAGLVAGAVKG